jgi:hypothetical protein
MSLLGAFAVSGAVYVVWLLMRTDIGRAVPAEADARLAAAVVLGVPPAWVAWQISGLLRGGSWGQVLAGLTTEGSRPRRVLRFALHPLALPFWGWLALIPFAAGAPEFALPVFVIGGLIGLGGLVSAITWAVAPGRPGVHDLIAGTRLRALAKPSQ